MSYLLKVSNFSAAVCKTVRPMLSDRCLSYLSCLSVCLSCPVCDVGVYCDQTVVWIKMKLGMQVGLGPGHIANGSQPLVARSSPYYENMWRRYRYLTSFSRLSIHDLAAKIQPDKVVRWCQKWRFFASCIFSEQREAHFRHAF